MNVFEFKNIYENILEYINKNGLKDKRLCFNLIGGIKMMFLVGLKVLEYLSILFLY